MSNQPKLYIAGIGMITPVGANTAMTAAAVRAGISGYMASDYFTLQTRQPITMSGVPDEIFRSMEFDIDEGKYYSGQYDHIIKMAILALREAVAGHTMKRSVPLLLTMPEEIPGVTYIIPELLLSNLLKQKDLPLRADLVRCIRTGRAAGIQGLELARHHLNEQGADFVLLGGSDSHWNASRIRELDEANRVLAAESPDGFAPGEGATFLLLTRHPELALLRNGHIIALYPPGIADEPGHMSSEAPYRGNGLDKAFKKALINHQQANIHSIYSSMNGEHYWAKEYGVAYIRNKAAFTDTVKVEHPADCYGDLGAATSPALIALAAEHLFNNAKANAHLVYSSSDTAKRGAVVVEKIAYRNT